MQIASEKRMRQRASELSEIHLCSEMALFSFTLHSGGEELRQAPFVYINDLKSKLFELLEKNERYLLLT